MKQCYSSPIFVSMRMQKVSVNVYRGVHGHTHGFGIRYLDRQTAIHGRGDNCLYRINVKLKGAT